MSNDNTKDLKRTNLRLPESVHVALKKAAIDRHTTMEKIVLEAVEKELSVPSHLQSKPVIETPALNKALRDLRKIVSRIENHLENNSVPPPA